MQPLPRFRALALSLLIVAGIAIGIYWHRLLSSAEQLRSGVLQQHAIATTRLAAAAATQTEALIRNLDSVLIHLRADYLTEPQEFDNSLRAVISGLPEGAVPQIGLIGTDGTLVASSLGMPKEKMQLGDREHFRVHVDGSYGDRLFVSTPVLGRRSNTWSIQLSRRIDRNGQFYGAIVASVSPEYLAAQLAKFELGERDTIALFRTDGIYLSRFPHLLDYMGKASRPDRPFLAPGAPSHGTFRTVASHEPVERLYAWRRLENLPLIVATGLAEADFIAPVEAEIRRNLIRNGVGTGLVVLLAGALAFLLLRLGHQQTELLAAANLYRSLFVKNTSVKLLIDPADGAIVDANPAACQFYGYDREQLLALKIGEINTLPLDELKAEMAHARDEKRSYFNCRHRLASGEVREVEVYSGPVDIEGKTLLHSIVHDVTERRRLEESLRISQSVFESTTEGILVTDADTVIVSVNPAFSRITGYRADQVIGHKPSILASGVHNAAFYREMYDALASQGCWEGEITNRKADGSLYVLWIKITAVKDGDGRITRYVALLSDITVRKRQEEELWRQANYDALTGLPNRVLFQDRLQQAMAQAIRRNGSGAVLFIDLDRFKTVNDTYGHLAGDELLRQTATRITHCLREEDTVARVGGDEFLVLLPSLPDHEVPYSVAEKILAVVNQPFHLAAADVVIGASIGVALFPLHAASANEVLDVADTAMYSAKASHRGMVRQRGSLPEDGGDRDKLATLVPPAANS